MNAPIRVIHVYSGNLFGGVESVLLTIARERAVRPGLLQDFALCFEGALSKGLREAGVTPNLLGGVRLSRPWSVWKARTRLRRLLERDRPNAMIFHSLWPLAVFGKVARERNLPAVLYLHNQLEGGGLLERMALKTHPALVIAVSQAAAASARKSLPHAKVECLYNPAPRPGAAPASPAREDLRRELGADATCAVILQASRIERLKGQDVLIRALARLKDRKDWICWIAGGIQRQKEEPYLAELKELVVANGLSDRVVFLGQRSDVSVLMSAADIFCQPNTGPEGLGMVFIEAMSAGLPVVTSAIGGAPEIVGPEVGFVLPPGDVDSLAARLAELIEKPALREEFGATGRAQARERFAPAAQLARLEALIRTVV